MVPRMTILQRIFAWALFKYEKFENLDEAEFEIEKNLTKTASRMRDYLYYRRSKQKT